MVLLYTINYNLSIYVAKIILYVFKTSKNSIFQLNPEHFIFRDGTF